MFYSDCMCTSVTETPVKFIPGDVIKWKYFPRHWPLWGESTGHRWFPLTEASDAEL